jgi:hypothetical protein
LSCQKDSDTNSGPSNTDNLTASTWKHESSGVDIDKNGTIDASLESLITGIACRLDNQLTFKKDNTAITDEGGTKCNTADPQTTTFNWSFADNETALNVSGNVFTALNGKHKIRVLNSTTFSLSKDTTLPAPVGNVAIVVNLKH